MAVAQRALPARRRQLRLPPASTRVAVLRRALASAPSSACAPPARLMRRARAAAPRYRRRGASGQTRPTRRTCAATPVEGGAATPARSIVRSVAPTAWACSRWTSRSARTRRPACGLGRAPRGGLRHAPATHEQARRGAVPARSAAAALALAAKSRCAHSPSGAAHATDGAPTRASPAAATKRCTRAAPQSTVPSGATTEAP